jgi:hypothetical protein
VYHFLFGRASNWASSLLAVNNNNNNNNNNNPKCLPEIYGGMQPHHSYEDWVEGFRKNKDIMKELKSLGYKTS